MTIEIRKAHRRTLSREALFSLVWEKPMTKVALELGISDVAVRKICVKHKIPRPPQGHWAAARPKSPPASLPSVPTHMEEISIYVPEKVLGRAPTSDSKDELPGKVEAVIAKGVPTRLGHGLGATYTELRRGDVDRYGYCRPNYQSGTHEVIATKASLKRAVYLMEYIFRVCGAAGFSIGSDEFSRNRWSMSSWVSRGGVSVSIRIKSSVRQIELDTSGDRSDYHKFTYSDSGKLSVTIGGNVTVRETDMLPLEANMPVIYRKIVREHEAEGERKRQRAVELRNREIREQVGRIDALSNEAARRQVSNLEAFKSQLMKIEENRHFYAALESHGELQEIDGFGDWYLWSKNVLPTEIAGSARYALHRHQVLSEIIEELKGLDPGNSELCHESLHQIAFKLDQLS